MTNSYAQRFETGSPQMGVTSVAHDGINTVVAPGGVMYHWTWRDTWETRLWPMSKLKRDHPQSLNWSSVLLKYFLLFFFETTSTSVNAHPKSPLPFLLYICTSVWSLTHKDDSQTELKPPRSFPLTHTVCAVCHVCVLQLCNLMFLHVTAPGSYFVENVLSRKCTSQPPLRLFTVLSVRLTSAESQHWRLS